VTGWLLRDAPNITLDLEFPNPRVSSFYLLQYPYLHTLFVNYVYTLTVWWKSRSCISCCSHISMASLSWMTFCAIHCRTFIISLSQVLISVSRRPITSCLARILLIKSFGLISISYKQELFISSVNHWQSCKKCCFSWHSLQARTSHVGLKLDPPQPYMWRTSL